MRELTVAEELVRRDQPQPGNAGMELSLENLP